VLEKQRGVMVVVATGGGRLLPAFSWGCLESPGRLASGTGAEIPAIRKPPSVGRATAVELQRLRECGQAVQESLEAVEKQLFM